MADATNAPTSTEFMDEALYVNVTQLGTAGRTGVANMLAGGQTGSGIRFPNIDAASPLVFNPAVIVVTHVPGMWREYPEMQEMLKSLVETHAKSITGIDIQYTMNTDETVVGHDGQTLKVPTRSTRNSVSPSMTFQEVSGNLVWNLMRMWISDMQHPDTNFSKLSAQIDASGIPPWLMSSYSMSMVAIQFDPTGLPERIIDAAVYTAMMPTETGNIGFKKEIGGNGESPERQITYKALVQHNQNTRELGKLIMQAQQLHKPDFTRALTFNGVDTALSGMGLSKEVNEALRDFRMVA